MTVHVEHDGPVTLVVLGTMEATPPTGAPADVGPMGPTRRRPRGLLPALGVPLVDGAAAPPGR